MPELQEVLGELSQRRVLLVPDDMVCQVVMSKEKRRKKIDILETKIGLVPNNSMHLISRK